MKKIFRFFTIALFVLSLLALSGCSDTGFSARDISSEADATQTIMPNDSSVDVGLPPSGLHDTNIPDTSGDIIEIKEKMFVAQSNDVYINANEYLGKTIKWEGLFEQITDPTNENVHSFVIRYGPGCCGYDANAGFEVKCDGEYPKANDWVQVSGVLDVYEENGIEYLYIYLSELNVLDERGAENVYQ